MLTRAQIVAFTKETVRRVLMNETGIAPRSDKHVQRLAELKAEEEARQEEERRQRAKARA
jgi:hypothetical protein